MKKLILSIALVLHASLALHASCDEYQKELPAFIESTDNNITFYIPHNSSKELPYHTFAITSAEGNITELIIESSEFNISFTFADNAIQIAYTSLKNTADNFSEKIQLKNPINPDTITTSYDGHILQIDFVYK
jgi:hypothetical protein